MVEGRDGADRRPKRRRLSVLARLEERTALLLLLPSFIILLLIAFYPFATVVRSSFTNARFASSEPTRYVGFDNYRRLLSLTIKMVPVKVDDAGKPVVVDGQRQYESSVTALPRKPERYKKVLEFGIFGHRYVVGAITEQFVRSIWDTLVFTVLAVVLETVLGMIIALTLASKFPGRGAMRAAMLVPWAVITAVSARIWQWMLQPTRAGLFNTVGSYLGISDGFTNFFGQKNLQLPSMIAMDVWKTTPFMALLLLAGLALIPTELYEAAAIDGASRTRRFLSVTLPLVAPTLAIALIFRTLDSLRVFDIFNIVLGNQRFSMASYAQYLLIGQREMGMSSAASVVIFILIFVFAILYMRVLHVDTE